MSTSMYPTLRNERCVRYRFRYSACSRCADVCPHEALTLSGEGAAIDQGQCRNCGLCVGACPTAAFQSGDVPGATVVREALERGRCRFACRPSGATGDQMVACLGALDAAMLAYLAKRGVAVSLAGAGHCAQCAHAPKGDARLMALLDAVAVLREKVGDEQWTEVTLEDDAGDGFHRDQSARRQFFRRLVGRRVAAAMVPEEHSAPVPARAVRAAAPYVPLARELLSALWREDARLPAHGMIFAGDMQPGENCTGCELCERVCPTAAFRISEQDGSWHLLFRSERCVGCGVCVEACQPGALKAVEELAAPEAEPRLMKQLRRTRCERCGRIYLPVDDGDDCPACRDDIEDFNAIFG